MSDSAACGNCGAPLPEGAAACLGCGARAGSTKLRPTATMQAVGFEDLGLPSSDPIDAAAGEANPAPRPTATRKSPPHPSQTDDTLFDLTDTARAAVEAARRQEAERVAAEIAKAQAAEAEAAQAARDAVASEEQRRARAAEVWPRVARSVMVVGGVVLLSLFGLAMPLLGALGGVQLVLAFYYLVGGIILASGALLPLPARLRAAFATLVGSVPLFVAGPLVADLGGWRGLSAALVILILPGALLLRARVTSSRPARLLVGLAVLLALLVYLVPADGLVPLRAALRLLASGDLTGMLTGVFFVAPLGLVLLTLTAFAGKGSTGYGNLWACLVLLVAAGAVMIEGQSRSDLSLTHLGIGLLAAGAAAAVGVADLLDLDAQAA